MPKRAVELSALEVGRLKSPGFYAVGFVAGLHLQVTPTGSRSWVLRAVVGSRRRDIGLGAFPGVTLSAARAKAQAARDQISAGIDPVERGRAERSARLAQQSSQRTFKQTATAYIEAHESGWRNAKHGQQWRNTLETYAYPVIGDLLVQDVQKDHVLAILSPIWATKTETASRVRSRIELVLSYAMQAGHRPEGLNPARWRGGLDKLLAKPGKIAKVEHHRAIPVESVGAFMERLRSEQGTGARCLEFAILTAARSGEARGARWSEMDLDAKVWTVPGSRMKAGKEHRVALSDAALKLLQSLARTQGEDMLFVSPRGTALSDMTLVAVLRRMEVDAVPHGFRSTFRDWAAERTQFSRDLAEMALAHTVGDKVEAAYRRGDMLKKRAQLMSSWASFLAKPEASASVLPMTRRA